MTTVRQKSTIRKQIQVLKQASNLAARQTLKLPFEPTHRTVAQIKAAIDKVASRK